MCKFIIGLQTQFTNLCSSFMNCDLGVIAGAHNLAIPFIDQCHRLSNRVHRWLNLGHGVTQGFVFLG